VRHPVAGLPADVWLDLQIFSQLEFFPFHSLASLAVALQSPRSTIYDHLIQLGFTTRHLRWVPHTLSSAHKKSRVELSHKLLGVIAQARHQAWKFFLTGDESWFYFQTDYSRIWLLPDCKPPQRARQTINTQKVMVTVFWSPLGFPVVEALAKRKTFTSDYFCETICTQFVHYAPPETRQPTGRRLTVHMDNALITGRNRRHTV
jgi:hypothetical protein